MVTVGLENTDWLRAFLDCFKKVFFIYSSLPFLLGAFVTTNSLKLLRWIIPSLCPFCDEWYMWFLSCKLTCSSFSTKKGSNQAKMCTLSAAAQVRAGQHNSWDTPGDALEKTASQHSRVLGEAAAIAMTNYCPFRDRYYNDGKRSITNELLEVAVQNSWAAEKDFIGTDRVKEEEILPHEGIERGSFLWC